MNLQEKVETFFENFLEDEKAPEMFITGPAGTGKTSVALATMVEHCHKNHIVYQVCAFTNKAVEILDSKLPNGSHTSTLHKFLRKRPAVNTNALRLAEVDTNTIKKNPDVISVLFIDEFSMIGSKDSEYVKFFQRSEQNPKGMKIVYLGDPNQLPPVKDSFKLSPRGSHQLKLTKIFRQADTNPLLDTLLQLNTDINKGKFSGLSYHETLMKQPVFLDSYKKLEDNKILLAYTNRNVQNINAILQGYTEPKIGDNVYCSNNKETYKILDTTDSSDYVVGILGEIRTNTGVNKTLDTLKNLGIKIYKIEHKGGYEFRAAIFGCHDYNKLYKKVAARNITLNNRIKNKYKVQPRIWCQINSKSELAKLWQDSWNDLIVFKYVVHCFDFKHAMTVHKAQGSTYDVVYIDYVDLMNCKHRNEKLFLKLLYVAISRAAKYVVLN